MGTISWNLCDGCGMPLAPPELDGLGFDWVHKCCVVYLHHDPDFERFATIGGLKLWKRKHANETLSDKFRPLTAYPGDFQELHLLARRLFKNPNLSEIEALDEIGRWCFDQFGWNATWFDLLHWRNVLLLMRWATRTTTEKPAIYISYAWGDDQSDAGRQRTAVVDGICKVIDEVGYEVLKDDRVLESGDWIMPFTKEIGRGDHVIVILSQKYLHSRYCMTELLHIYNWSQGDKEHFLKRVIPVVLDDACDVSDKNGRLKYAEFWKAEMEKMESQLPQLGTLDFEHYQLIKQWHAVIGNILGFISDTLHPHGTDAIAKDGFAAVRKMLPCD